MPLILLVRHGENDYVRQGKFAGRIPGIHLNEKGQHEAEEIAAALKELPIAAIYSSPLERAIETAKPLAKAKGLNITFRKGLLETDLGEWKGLEIKKVSKHPAWKTVQSSPSRFRFPGGESFLEEQRRLVEVVEQIIAGHKPDDLVVIVSHADPIKLIIAYYLGMPLDYFQRIACSPGSVSILGISKETAALLGLNLKPPFHFPIPKKKKK